MPSPTTCGAGECAGNTGQLLCQNGSETDTCDPYAGAAPNDSVCNGLDDDCDGPVDEDFVTTPTTCGQGVCASAGQIECQSGSEVDTCAPGPQDEPTDVICDGLDGDCDGATDEDFASTPTTCGIGACESTGNTTCVDGDEGDTCTEGTPQNEGPMGDATCSDGSDNDCDSKTDGGDPDCQMDCSVYDKRGPCNDDPACEWQGDKKNGVCVPIPVTCIDNDQDGYGANGDPSCPNAGVDCNDNNAAINPGADDSNCNGVDEDCSGISDDGYMPTPTTCGDGVCASTGQLECQSGSEVDTCTPGPQDEPTDVTCDGLDGDCDGSVDEDYVVDDTCGLGVCGSPNNTPSSCVGGVETTCAPGPAGTEGPEGDQTCSDTLDNDCDGLTDTPEDPDCACVQTGQPDDNCDGIDDDCNGTADDAYVATPTTCGVGECSGNTGLLECQSGSTVDTCDPLAGALPDDNCDGLDNDCDGTADDDYVTTPTTCGVGECAGNAGQLTCQSGSEVDTCDPLAGALPDNNCDGLDNDCDGAADDDYVITPTTCGVGECSGNTGQLTCQSGTEVDDCDPIAGAAPNDSFCDGLDEDCDGVADEDYTSMPTTCGLGECESTGNSTCVGGVVGDTCTPGTPPEDPEATCDDGLDNDCDGLTDDPDPDCVFCIDNDGDGYGDGESCLGLDCDDNDPNVNPGATEGPYLDGTCGDLVDNDCDFTVDGADHDCLDPAADNDNDGFIQANECDDTDPNVYPDAPELCDGKDSNCDGYQSSTDVDNDGDGHPVCLNDCNDSDPNIFPGAAEVCDGLDNNCDYVVPLVERDLDGDGFLECDAVPDCDNNDPTVYPGAPELCDFKDNDCNAGTPVDESCTCVDFDGDGHLPIHPNCAGGDDCDDTDSNNFPGNIEDCTDGQDNDCDTIIDIQDPDAMGCPIECVDNDADTYWYDSSQTGVNCGGVFEDCNDNNPDVNPGEPNEVCDGEDTNCDGWKPPSDVDNDGDGVAQCAECDDSDPNNFPGNAENCVDGVDNDCDGLGDDLDPDCDCTPTGLPDDNCDQVDDDCNGVADDAYVPPTTTCGVGECAGNTGELACQNGSLVNTCDPLEGALPTDNGPNSCNGLDDDCDGFIDEDYVITPTTCGQGVCASTGQLECQNGTEVDTCAPGLQEEPADFTCDGRDGDCDGLTDEDFIITPTNCGDGVCAATGNIECQSGSEVDTCTPGPQNEPTDITCDNLDGDCDGQIDEDYVITGTTCGVGICAGNTGQMTCQSGSEIDDCNPLAGAVVEGPTGDPTCEDGLDNNCNGLTDTAEDPNCQCTPTGLPDDNCDGIDDDCNGVADDAYPSTPTNCGLGVCASTGEITCVDAQVVDTCTPGPQEESTDVTCDGRDGDCDGQTDEDFVTTPTTCGVGVCAGNTGQLECQIGAVVDTCDPLAGQTEPTDVTCDGLDGDCDGPADEDYVSSTTSCGTGVCASTGVLQCAGGTETDTCSAGSPTETPEATCDDGLDNDCDGLTDGPDDPDCVLETECIICHNGDPATNPNLNPPTDYVTRDVVGVDFLQASRHVFGGSPTNWDCIICHREGDEVQAEAGVVANTAFHQDAQVDMRNVDNPTTGWVWDKNNTDDLMYTDMDTFCMRCHDSDSSRGVGMGGASGIAVATGDGGVTLSPTLDERMKPYNSSDGLDQGTGGGTKFLVGYERTAVLDAYGQYDPSNTSHHAVRGRAYSSHDTDWGSTAWVDVALKGSGLDLVSSGLYETAMLHCADCHTVDQAAHGGANGFMLQASTIDGTCYRCHNSNVYSANGAAGSRWTHNQDSSVWSGSDAALIGAYRGDVGSKCMLCHGGKIGEAGTVIGYDGYGGIHGLPSGVDTRSGEERYRFQGGSYMSHSPGSWTTTAGSSTCYFEGGDQDWSSCTRHTGTETGRTSPGNYDRPVPDNPDAP
jgi:hypothetical protein